MQWTQVYDPLGHWWLSTLVAALPIIILFTLLAGLKVKPHWCAIAGASTAVAVAIVFFKCLQGSHQLCLWCGLRGIEDRLDRSG